MKINIRFVTENYNSNITNFYRKEFKIIKNGIEYSYDQKTTIRDLFISLTTKFIRPYIKIGKCNPFKLFSNFSLFFEVASNVSVLFLFLEISDSNEVILSSSLLEE